jgi:hypothetical protein
MPHTLNSRCCHGPIGVLGADVFRWIPTVGENRVVGIPEFPFGNWRTRRTSFLQARPSDARRAWLQFGQEGSLPWAEGTDDCPCGGGDMPTTALAGLWPRPRREEHPTWADCAIRLVLCCCGRSRFSWCGLFLYREAAPGLPRRRPLGSQGPKIPFLAQGG